MWNVIWMLCILLVTNVYCINEVTTKQGKIRGRIWTSQRGREFVGFTGIPYAKPPVGKLRFQAPLPGDPWIGTLNATSSHNACPQADDFAKNFTPLGNEDCLYLNVYKPLIGKHHPVMFYIHGGSFIIGSGADNWLGPEILLDSNVILVTVNYRLGALGFLSRGDIEQPGNNGLKDQALALRWVKDNIKYFGGDDSNITVFGNSAGGISAHWFTMSALTKDLIARVVIQSGTTIFSPSTKENANLNAEKLGRLLNCSTNSTWGLINCLQEVDVIDILRSEYSFGGFNNSIPQFGPVVEIKHLGAFLAEDPVDIMMSKKFANIPIMLGMVEQEGAYVSALINAQPTLLKKFNTNFDSLASENFPIVGQVSKTAGAIRQFYLGNKTIDNSTKLELATIFSDGWLLSSMDLTLYLFLAHKFPNQSIYVYLFGYKGSTSYSMLYGDSFDYGAGHSDELLYLLPNHFLYPKYQPTTEDLSMANLLRTFWADFAETGNPTPVSRIWKPLQDGKLQYLHIKSPTNVSMDEGLYSNRRKFWREEVYKNIWKRVTNDTFVY